MEDHSTESWEKSRGFKGRIDHSADLWEVEVITAAVEYFKLKELRKQQKQEGPFHTPTALIPDSPTALLP